MTDKNFLPESIEDRIHFIRGRKVMLDFDLAGLYEVETKSLKRQVRRNIQRFPNDFMFELSNQELNNWRCQNGTSNQGIKMGLRTPPFAFTELGIAMLSSVLNTEKAISVNIQIMRTFSILKVAMNSNEQLHSKILEMEKKYDHKFKIVFDAIRQLVELPATDQRRIGFRGNGENES